jgi:hypothetical protein
MSSDVFISDGLTRERISPATANLQREIRDVLQEILDEGHENFETQAITLGGGGLGRGVNLPCKDVQIATNGTDVQVVIVDSADSGDDATTQGFLLSSLVTASPLPVKVDNVGRLRFIGSAAAVVYILARV